MTYSGYTPFSPFLHNLFTEVKMYNYQLVSHMWLRTSTLMKCLEK